MRLKPSLAVLIAIVACISTANAQTQNTAAPSTPLPKFISMIHYELKPGFTSTYEASEASLANTYTRENSAVYWIGLESVTGGPEALSVQMFASPEEFGRSLEARDKAMAAHSDISQARDHAMQESTSGAETIVMVRREDMGYRTNSIDLSKMRALRMTTIFVHPGYERAFVQAEWTLSAAYEKVNAKLPWVVYQVSAGLPTPAFVVLTPMQSLGDLDQLLATDSNLQKPENENVEENLEELSRVAYGSVETHLYRVKQKTSHVSKDFAASDPQFWNTAASSEPETSTAPKSTKLAPKKTTAKP